MTIDSKQKRSKLGYQRFVFSAFCTFFFLSLYFLGLYLIPAPESFLNKFGNFPERKLLGRVFNCQLFVNTFVFGISAVFAGISNVFSKDNEVGNRQSIEKLMSSVSKLSKPNVVALVGIMTYWEVVKNSPYLLFLTYLSFFVSNSVFELIVEALNEHGLCKGFELIFLLNSFSFKVVWELFFSLIKTISFRGNHSDLDKSLVLFFVFLIIYSFIVMSNRKWEIPINTNRIGPTQNSIVYSPKFTLQMNFSLYSFLLIQSLIKACGVLCETLLKITKGSSKVPVYKEFLNLWEKYHLFETNSSSLKETFFAINESTNPFFNLCKKGFENPNFIFTLVLWSITIHLINWFVISNSQLDSNEISERLEKSGAYLDGVRPGEETKKLISSIVSTMIFVWALHLIILNISFDNLITAKQSHFSFIRLFIAISTSIAISKQIKKRYDQSKLYD